MAQRAHRAQKGRGRMAKLTPQQEEQLISMIKEGKENGDINTFFKQNYQIEIPGWKFNYIRAKLRNPMPGPGAKRTRKQRKTKVESEQVDPLKEIVALMAQIDSGYRQIFKHLRLELIKSRGQVYEMMKGAGIEVPEGE